jgi:predicted Rdx family selenoprotein
VKRGPVGIFDVYADEWVVYSNRREGGRLPQNEQVIQRIRDYQARLVVPSKGRSNSNREAPTEVDKSQTVAECGPGCG